MRPNRFVLSGSPAAFISFGFELETLHVNGVWAAALYGQLHCVLQVWFKEKNEIRRELSYSLLTGQRLRLLTPKKRKEMKDSQPPTLSCKVAAGVVLVILFFKNLGY